MVILPCNELAALVIAKRRLHSRSLRTQGGSGELAGELEATMGGRSGRSHVMGIRELREPSCARARSDGASQSGYNWHGGERRQLAGTTK